MTNQTDKAPAGATHRYEHGGMISWYREAAGGLFVWRDGSWYASTYNTALELSRFCPLGAVSTFSEEKQPERTEDDLTWLVRESRGEWFGSHPTHIARDGDLLTWATFPRLPEGYHWFTKAEYLARRAELQNKPSWAGHQWPQIFQNEDGHWFGARAGWDFKAHIRGGWKGEGVSLLRDDGEYLQSGEVLGDWRDTLEQRPDAEADITDPFDQEFRPVTVSNETVPMDKPVAVSGTGNGSAAESAFLIGRVIDLLRTSAGHFSADELAEMHQLCDAELTKRDAAVCGGQKYLDATWFERGELPPVGARVMHMGTATDKDWLEVEIIAHAQRKGFKVAVFEYQGGVSFSSATYFRPVRTERDELIDVLKGTHAASLTNLDMLASAILASGFKRGGV